jgi:hypothetical protein
MDDLQRMLIEHACQRLMSLYCTHLDYPNPDAFAGLYAEDAMYKPAARPEPVYGRQAIRDWMQAYPKHRFGRHITTNQVVDVIDDDNATGKSYAIVFREPDPREGEISPAVMPRSVVEYSDTFRRTAEGWRFSKRYYNIHFLQDDETVRPPEWSEPS